MKDKHPHRCRTLFRPLSQNAFVNFKTCKDWKLFSKLTCGIRLHSNFFWKFYIYVCSLSFRYLSIWYAYHVRDHLLQKELKMRKLLDNLNLVRIQSGRIQNPKIYICYANRHWLYANLIRVLLYQKCKNAQMYIRMAISYIQKAKKLAETFCQPRKIGGKCA